MQSRRFIAPTKIRSAAAAVLVAPALSICACESVGTVTEISVGNAAEADGGSDGSLVTASPDATMTGTLMHRLDTKCAAPAGQLDTYTSAAELTSRLTGRWYHCASSAPDDWKLPRGTGMAFDFSVDGAWAFLDYMDAPQSFTPSTATDRSGQVLYYVYAGMPPEAGPVSDGSVMDAGAFSSMFVRFDDTVTRNGLIVELQSVTEQTRQFKLVFAQNPRQLQLQELSDGVDGGAVFATFVPID